MRFLPNFGNFWCSVVTLVTLVTLLIRKIPINMINLKKKSRKISKYLNKKSKKFQKSKTYKINKKYKYSKNKFIFQKKYIDFLVFFKTKQNAILLNFHLGRLIFNQSSPIHPVSESRGVSWAWRTTNGQTGILVYNIRHVWRNVNVLFTISD